MVDSAESTIGSVPPTIPTNPNGAPEDVNTTVQTSGSVRSSLFSYFLIMIQ